MAPRRTAYRRQPRSQRPIAGMTKEGNQTPRAGQPPGWLVLERHTAHVRILGPYADEHGGHAHALEQRPRWLESTVSRRGGEKPLRAAHATRLATDEDARQDGSIPILLGAANSRAAMDGNRRCYSSA